MAAESCNSETASDDHAVLQQCSECTEWQASRKTALEYFFLASNQVHVRIYTKGLAALWIYLFQTELFSEVIHLLYALCLWMASFASHIGWVWK